MTTYEIASESEVIDATTGTAISVEGCLSLSFICSGTASASVTVTLQECDTEDGTFTDVSADDVYGSFAQTKSDTTTKVGVIGYLGFKNYVKVKTDGSATTLAVTALKTGCRHCPTQ